MPPRRDRAVIRNLSERDGAPDRGASLDHQFSLFGSGYGMCEAKLRTAQRLSRRTPHYHQRRSDDAAS